MKGKQYETKGNEMELKGKWKIPANERNGENDRNGKQRKREEIENQKQGNAMNMQENEKKSQDNGWGGGRGVNPSYPPENKKSLS